jgi:acylphosphatase
MTLIFTEMRSRCFAQPEAKPASAHSLLHETHSRLNLTSLHSFATISKLVDTAKKASRFFVTGLVQGVGFRFFAVAEAERLNLSGYVRNRRDGRVEAYAVGTPEQLAQFRARLEKGPRLSSVRSVAEEPADIDPQFTSGFVTTPTF